LAKKAGIMAFKTSRTAETTPQRQPRALETLVEVVDLLPISLISMPFNLPIKKAKGMEPNK